MMISDRRPSPERPSDSDMTSSHQPVDDAVSSAVNHPSMQGYDPQLIEKITQSVIKQLQMNSRIMSPMPQHSPPPSIPSPVITDCGEPVKTTQIDSPEPLDTPAASNPPSPGKRRVSFTDSVGRPQFSSINHEIPNQSEEAGEESPLDKKWGVLFDDSGAPTPRLGQLFRGIAVHLIEDCEPKHSMVVTPEKLAEYYRQVKLEKETYPWHIVCDDRLTYVSRMYRTLGCQHHLIQDSDFKRPDIPGLTPSGFATWMTMVLCAHPEEEFLRLRRVIVAKPIDNPDDKSERFPKDISRRLFPQLPSIRTRNKLRQAMREHAETAHIEGPEDDDVAVESVGGSIEELKASPRDSPSQQRRRETECRSSTLEPGSQAADRLNQGSIRPEPIRPQNHTVGADNILIPDDEHVVTSKPIERERKPYTVLPGGGRMFDDPLILQPAGGRANNMYPSKAGSITGSSVSQPSPALSHSPTSPSYLPHANSFPFQASMSPPRSAPAPGAPGVGRSNSASSRTRTYSMSAAPFSGTAGNGVAGNGPPHGAPEIHQQQPPPPPPTGQRIRRGSNSTKRRAPSGSQGYMPGAGDGLAFQSFGLDARQPVYAERNGGHDGYGPYEDDGGTHHRRRSSAYAEGRRDSRDYRRESPVRRERTDSRGYGKEEEWYRYRDR